MFCMINPVIVPNEFGRKVIPRTMSLHVVVWNQALNAFTRWIQAGFYGIARLSFIQLDWGLITTLLERLRPETHTFHMRHGEMTVTLEDIAVQFDLPINRDNPKIKSI